MRKKVLAWCAFLTIVIAAAPARASTITPGDTWYEFLFGGPGTFGGACASITCPAGPAGTTFAPTAPWTFSGAVTLTVTDVFNSGDNFKVFDNNVLLGITPVVGTNSDCGDDPNWCSQDTGFTSSGTFDLLGGDHSLTIQLDNSPYGHGVGYFRAEPVPEPASMFLLGTGALGLVARYRRRRGQQP